MGWIFGPRADYTDSPELQQLIQTPFVQDTLAVLLPYAVEFTARQERRPDFAASAPRNNPNININPEGALWGKPGTDELVRQILAHEFGHKLQDEPVGKGLYKNIKDEWQTVRHRGPYGTYDEYVRKSPEEYFADLVSVALLQVIAQDPQYHAGLAQVVEQERPGVTQIANYLQRQLQRRE